MPPGDEELMSRIQAGDRAAFNRLYERHASLVLDVARRAVDDASEAEDVRQEVFLAVWRYRSRYRSERAPVRAWLIWLARNRAIDTRQRASRRAATQRNAVGAGAALIVEDAGSAAVAAEEALALTALLAELPPRQRRVLELGFYAELTQGEIARELAVPVTTIAGRRRTALRTLRGRLAAGARAPAATGDVAPARAGWLAAVPEF